MAQTIKLKRSGTQGAAPTTSNLALGEVAINTYDGKMYIKKSVGGTESIVEIGGTSGSVSYLEAGMIEYEYTATSNQTTFSGSDSNSATLSYTANSIMVFLNGVLQDDGVDYTATNGTSVVFTSALTANDEVRIVAFTNVTTSGSLQNPTKLDAITTVNAQAAYSLTVNSSAYTPSSEAALIVSLNGITQEPGDSFTISGSTITFSPALVTGDVVDYIVDMGRAVTIGQYDSDLVVTNGNVEVPDGEFVGDLRGATLFKGQAGEALSKGDVVYISGISGNTTVVSKADADDATKMPAFGVVAAAASINTSVSIYTFGELSGLDTSSYSEGDELFVSTTAGGLTNSAPTGESSKLQKIAKVTRSDNSAGSIFIMGAGRSNAVPNLDDGDIFIGNASNQSVSAALDTSIVPENGNLYHTTERVQDVTGEQFVTNGTHTGISFAYDDANDGAIDATVSLASFDTDDLSEGATNLYYTDARVDSRLASGSVGNIVTTGYLRGPSTFTIDPATHGDNTGTLVVAGNLQVDGTTTTINSTTVTVDDLNITLASGAANAAAANGAGITVDGASATLTYSSTSDAWSFNKNLGIGTASPSFLLHAYETPGNGAYSDTTNMAATARFHSTEATTGSYTAIQLAANNGNSALGWWNIGTVSTSTNYDNHLVFQTRTGSATYAERMRIDSSGNLLVGTTSTNPSGNNFAGGAEVNGATGQFNASRDGGAVIDVNRKTNDGEIARFRKDGTTIGSIGSEGGDSVYIGNGDAGLKFSGGADAIQPFNTTTVAARDDAISLGTSGARFNSLYLSGFISNGSNVGAKTFAVASGGVTSLRMQQARGTISSPAASSSGGDGTYIVGEVYNGSTFNAIGHIAIVTDNGGITDGNILFRTATSGTISTKMHLDSDGSLYFPRNYDASLAGGIQPTGNYGYRLFNAGGATSAVEAMEGYLTFKTGGLTASEERMRIASNGKVGIDETNPTHALHVKGDTSDTIDETKGTLKLQGTTGGNGLIFGTTASSPFTSYIQSAYVVDTSLAQYAIALNPIGGNVGIGIKTPATTLHIHVPGAGATNVGYDGGSLRLSGGGWDSNLGTYTHAWTLTTPSVYSSSTGHSNPALVFTQTAADGLPGTGSPSDIERMRIDQFGRVLVGNISSALANESFRVNGATNTSATGAYPVTAVFSDTRAYNSTNPASGGGIGFSYKYTSGGGDAVGGSIQGYKENTTDGDYAGGLKFLTRTNGSHPAERMRIDSSGNVGIGTAPSIYAKLHVEGDVKIGARQPIYTHYGTNANWVKIYERHYLSTSFNYGQHNILITQSGSTNGHGSTARLYVNTKQQGTGDYFDIQYQEVSGEYDTDIAYYYDASGGDSSAGILTIWARKTASYTQISVTSDASTGSDKHQSGQLMAVDTGSGTQPANSTLIQPNMRLLPTGKGISLERTAGENAFDVTANATTIANNGTVDFPSMSGMIIANNWNTGDVTLWLVGGGVTTRVSSTQSGYGTMTYVSGIAGYRWTNNTGVSRVMTFTAIRTRNTA